MSTASGDEYLVADARITALETPAPPATKPVHWPFMLVLLVALSGLGLIAAGSLREGLIGLTMSLALASVLRLLLPGATAQWLSSRTRGVDAGLLAALAGSLGAVTLLLFS